jgi:hypothetical protein
MLEAFLPNGNLVHSQKSLWMSTNDREHFVGLLITTVKKLIGGLDEFFDVHE